MTRPAMQEGKDADTPLRLARHGFDMPYPPESGIRWRPSIHMPRWASRLTLIVTDVRVQRLQDISKEDVIAEGISEREGYPIADVHAGWHEPFAALWNKINGDGAWEANPWVAAYSFEVLKQNIDAAPSRPLSREEWI